MSTSYNAIVTRTVIILVNTINTDSGEFLPSWEVFAEAGRRSTVVFQSTSIIYDEHTYIYIYILIMIILIRILSILIILLTII